MSKNKKTLWEKITGVVKMNDTEDFDFDTDQKSTEHIFPHLETEEYATRTEQDLLAETEDQDNEEGQLTVDVYQTSSEIIIKAMVAGVRSDELDITITREMVVIKGTRSAERSISDSDYFHKELYWGAFSRTILLPYEVEPDEADATEKNGLLTIRLPKIDKSRQKKVRVKSGQ
jgi:HSP20 family molecular chaperone IbpA